MLNPSLLTSETSLVLIIDYQPEVFDKIRSADHELIELNARALARVAKGFRVPVILSTIGVKTEGHHPTLSSIRRELSGEPEYDRTTMNAWEDDAVREAVARTGRRRLIFAGIWTEVCHLFPVLHAQREGFETYFVADAIGGGSVLAHEMAILRMVQAGSQPMTLNSLVTEWLRDRTTSPYTKEIDEYMKWYVPEITRIRKRLLETPYQGDAA